MKRVTLVSVHYFTWTCPECGNENRHVGRVCRDEHALKEISEEMGEDFKVGELLEHPSQVACPKCEGVFGVCDPDGGDEWKDGSPSQ